MNAVMYGAGNVGRGFIGPLFSGAGYKVTFIDSAENIINALNEKGSYPVKLVSNDDFKEIKITGVSAINCFNENEAMDCISKADIMATAVGVRALPLIAPIIAGALKKRFKINSTPFNIIICENLVDADKYFSDLVKKYLDAAELKQFEEQIGFVETSIGRMIPVQTPQMQEENILRVCTEKYAFLPVNKNAFKGKIPEIEGMIPYENFNFFIRRKLYIHNMGHAVCAFLGLISGEKNISDAASRADVLFIAQNAMFESAAALHREFNVELQDIIDHIMDLLKRFNNKALKDTCMRVGADIERKLKHNDRFIGAINCCKKQGVIPAFISIGAAAALYWLLKERSINQTEENASSVLETTSALDKKSDESVLILEMYKKIINGAAPAELLNCALLHEKKAAVI